MPRRWSAPSGEAIAPALLKCAMSAKTAASAGISIVEDTSVEFALSVEGTVRETRGHITSFHPYKHARTLVRFFISRVAICPKMWYIFFHARVAQPVEQRFRKAEVASSILASGSML